MLYFCITSAFTDEVTTVAGKEYLHYLIMAPAKEVGVVVIGIGMTGRIRIRDLLSAADDTSLGLKLIGYVSR